jgi:hypothetical protein
VLRPLYLRERVRGAHCIDCWVWAPAGLDNMDKYKFLTLPGLELRLLGRRARSQYLYRLLYGGYFSTIIPFLIRRRIICGKVKWLDSSEQHACCITRNNNSASMIGVQLLDPIRHEVSVSKLVITECSHVSPHLCNVISQLLLLLHYLQETISSTIAFQARNCLF